VTPRWFRRELALGDSGPDVDVVRRKLGLGPGIYDRTCIERVKGMAKAKGKTSDGTVTEEVADILGETETTKAGLPPGWYVRDLELGSIGEDVRALRKALDVWDDNRFEVDLEAAVRRFQSAEGLIPDGKVTADLAVLIGE
jgi:peptidoglycan hydrolase-like protein with peptidoglycan-binding domain